MKTMNAEQLIKYLSQKRFNVQKARASILAMDACFNAYINSKATKNVLSPIFCFIQPYNSYNYFYQIIGEEPLKKMAREIYNEFLNNPPSFYKKFEIKTKIGKEIDNFWKRYSTARKKKLSGNDLLRFFDELNGLWGQWWQYASFMEDKGELAYNDFLPVFAHRHKMSETEAEEIIGILTHPQKLAVFNQERWEYINLQLLMALKAGKKRLEKSIQKYIKKYFWIKSDFYAKEEITYESVFKEIKKEAAGKTAKRIKNELLHLRSFPAKIEEKKRAILRKIKLYPEDKKYFEFAIFMIAWQDERKEEMMKQFYYLFSLVEDICSSMGILYDDAVACFTDEIKEFLKNGKFAYKKPKDLFVAFYRNEKPKIFSGQTAKKLLKIVIDKSEDTSKELKGVVASRGQAQIIKGRIKIISNPKEQKFKKGDILVTSMTRVEFAPIMNLAKAIITDEGGIASHAAIISRELGIPCIIGTKFATKVLKDGDLVEIDSNKGTVKIIR